MKETLTQVVPIRPGLAARYGATQAMNDIHALLTGPIGLTVDEATVCVAENVARTGRRLDRARTVTAEVTVYRHGIPVARVDADGTVVLVGQDPDGPGALVQATTRDAAEAAGLVITIDGRPVGRSPIHVRPEPPGRAPRRPVTDRDGAQPGCPDREGDSS